MKKDNTALYQEAVKNLLIMFERGQMPEAVAFNIIRKQKGVIYKPSDCWSIGNQILQLIQHTEDARGFRQWKDVGRSVIKGRKAIHILAPMTFKVKKTNPVTGEEEERIVITGFRPISVFRYEDTEGEELDYIPEFVPPEPPPFWNVADKLGIKVSYIPMLGNYLGQFNMRSNSIKLCSEDAIVYFHELSHAVHNTFVDLRKCDHAVAETVAEFSAVVLAHIQGITGFEHQGWEYIQEATKTKGNPEEALKFIMQCLSDVEKVVSIILDTAENNTINEKTPAEAV